MSDDYDLIDYKISLQDGAVIFDCGYRAPIVNMMDKYGDETDVIEDVVKIVAKVPEAFIYFDLRQMQKIEQIH